MSASFENTHEDHESFLNRVTDRANAILVKETRQALKSRQFAATFLLLLTGAWLYFTFGMLNAGSAIEYGATGRTFFYGFYFGLVVASVLFVPYGAYRSLLAERDLDTFELLHITTLSPRQIVWGKLLNAILQLFIFFSALTPFIAFAALLQGFDMPWAAFLLVTTFIFSIFLSMFALMLSSLTDKNTVSQGLTSFVVIGGLVFSLFSTFGVATGGRFFGLVDFSNPMFWLGYGSLLLLGLTYFALFQQITVARLTFESGNRSSGIRLICMIQFLLFWVDYLIATRVSTRTLPVESVLGLAGFSIFHWSLVGLFATTEGDFLSRRIRRDLPSGTLKRWLYTPFLPGGSRGYLFVLGNLMLLWFFAMFAMTNAESMVGGVLDSDQWQLRIRNSLTFQISVWSRELRAMTALLCYCVIFLSVANMLSRWGAQLTSNLRPIYIRVIVLFLAAAGIFTPNLMQIMKLIPRANIKYSFLYLSDPFATIGHIERRGPLSTQILYALTGIAVFCIVVNSQAMIRGIMHVLTANVQPRKASDVTSAVANDE